MRVAQAPTGGRVPAAGGRDSAPGAALSRENAMSVPSLTEYLRTRVVIDTQGPLIYIGRLDHFDDSGYWLGDADVHDRNDGHSGKESYINQASELERTGSRTVNRKRVFVERHAVVSVSALDEVVAAADDADLEPWVRGLTGGGEA